MFIVELLINFLYRFSFLSTFLLYMFYIIVGFFIFVVLIIYIDIGVFEWKNLSLYFDTNTYIFLFERHKREIYIFILIQQLVFLAYLLYLKRKLKLRLNCELKQIHIEDIASSWLSYQSLKENILKEEINNITPTQTSNENKQYQYIKFSHTSLMKFWERIADSLIQNINETELDIIIKLMQYLDENPNTPSVVSYCPNDSNQKYKIEKITSDGKSSYDILAKVSLCEHSVGVAEKILELNNNQTLLYGKMIIVALAHDIGKIINHQMQTKSKNLFIEHSHQHISYIYLREKFGTYPYIEEISKVVKAHHDSKVSTGKYENLTKLLIQADKERRNDELNEYFIENPKAKPFEKEEAIKQEQSSLDDILKDFEGLGLLANERKDNEKIPIKKKIIKDDEEMEFDFAKYEEQIFLKLSSCINKSINYGYESFVESISYKDMILFSKQCIINVLKEVLNGETHFTSFVRFYREKKYIAYIDTDKDFYSSKFILLTKEDKIEFDCVPIFARVFDIEVQDLELSKNQDKFLKSIKVSFKKESVDE
ncbi:HD domain-containing protein [Campylobacter upsaliensis]